MLYLCCERVQTILSSAFKLCRPRACALDISNKKLRKIPFLVLSPFWFRTSKDSGKSLPVLFSDNKQGVYKQVLGPLNTSLALGKNTIYSEIAGNNLLAKGVKIKTVKTMHTYSKTCEMERNAPMFLLEWKCRARVCLFLGQIFIFWLFLRECDVCVFSCKMSHLCLHGELSTKNKGFRKGSMKNQSRNAAGMPFW